jgi:arylsulfatase A-like enzyme
MVENTIVIFTTDHGEYMGANGLMAKGGFLWEEFVNLPFVIRYPKEVTAGLRSEALFSFVDIVPTLLDYAGIDQHGLAPDGISQRKVFNGTEDHLRTALTILHPSQGDSSMAPDQHALITEEWKLVYYAGDPNGELYNLEDDPKELNNLYNQPEAQEIQRSLILRLLDEIILQNDKAPQLQARTADHYGKHVMTYEMWEKEFDQLKEATGKE